MTRHPALVFASALLAFSCACQMQAAPQWTDRGEYDLVLMIRSEGSPQKRLDLIDSWRKQYPKSQLAESRLELALATWGSMRDWANMLVVAKEINAAEPSNPVGLYWCASLIPGTANASPELIATAEKSARALLAGGSSLFAPARKPEQVSAEEWKTNRASANLIAHRALGWAAWHREDLATATTEFAAALKEDPKNAEISAWMGIVLALQKDKPAESLWSLLRAGALRESGALPDEARMQIAQTAERAYVSYHGSTDGLDALRVSALASPLAPPDFTIESGNSVELRRLEEQARPANPQLAEWLRMRRLLEEPNGDTYFKGLLNQPLPKLKATVIRCSPETKPEQVTLGLKDATTEEVILKFDAPMRFAAEPGTEIEFVAKPESFHKAPFQLVLTTDAKSVEGWPAKAAGRKR